MGLVIVQIKRGKKKKESVVLVLKMSSDQMEKLKTWTKQENPPKVFFILDDMECIRPRSHPLWDLMTKGRHFSLPLFPQPKEKRKEDEVNFHPVVFT